MRGNAVWGKTAVLKMTVLQTVGLLILAILTATKTFSQDTIGLASCITVLQCV